MGAVVLTQVLNPLDRTDKDRGTYEFCPDAGTVADLMRTAVHPGRGGDLVDFVVSVNGRELAPAEWAGTKLVSGQEIVVVPVFHGGGGGGGKNPLRTVLMVIVAVVAIMAPYTAPAGWGLLTAAGGVSATGALVSAAILTAGSMLVNAIAPMASPQDAALNGAGGLDQSNAYSWNPQTTQQQGVCIPVPYGTCKLTGNIISAYRETVGADQYLNVLISLGEGPVSSISDVKINGQPLANYRGVTVNTRLGRLNQLTLPGFNDTRVEYTMGTKVVAGSPVTYTTIGSDFDGLEIELTAPNGLYYYDASGNLQANSVNYRIEIRPEGGAWTTITSQVLTQANELYEGRWSKGYWLGVVWYESEAGTSDPSAHYEGQQEDAGPYWWRWVTNGYEPTVSTLVDYVTLTRAQTQAVRVEHKQSYLTRGQKYEIRITNLTADQTSTVYGDDIFLSAVKEVTSDDFTYPGEILMAVRALATDQLSGGFSVECRTTGKLCRVYRDGAWHVEPTNNRAWICFDLLTQPVFLDTDEVAEYRAHDPSALNLTRWIEWAALCDDLVPDGEGGTEKRLTWDGVFDSVQTMWESALTVAAYARATPYWQGNKITVALDKAVDLDNPAFLISVGNIGKDSFEETFLSLDGRAGSVEADYLNIENDLTRDKMIVYNADAPEDWGAATRQLQGEIRPSGVYRICRFELARTQALLRIVSVSLSTDSIAFTLGDVGYVQHDVPQWGEGGRLVSATTSSVTIDKQVTITAGKTYAVMVRFTDGSTAERTLTNVPGTTATLTFATPLSTAPAQYDVWAFGEVGVYLKPMRVIGIEPQGDQRRRILLEDYNASLYTLDDDLPLVPTPNYTPISEISAVTNLALEDRLVMDKGVLTTLLSVTWDRPDPSSNIYKIEVLAGSAGQPQTSRAILAGDSTSFEWPVLDGEVWTVTVRSGDGVFWRSLTASPSQTRTIVGKLAPPEDVVNFRADVTGFGGLILSWDAVSDLDVDEYAIRYSSALVGATWENSVALPVTGKATSIALPAALDGTYFVKAKDRGGRLSTNAASLITAIPSLIQYNAVETANDGVSWPGTKVGTYVSGGKLRLDMAGVWDDITDFDAIENLDNYGGLLAAGTYDVQEVVDLGVIQTSRCGIALDFAGVDTAALWDDITDFDAVADLDGFVPGVSVEPQISLSDNGTDWTDWVAFIVGDYTARYYRFRLSLSSSVSTNYPEVTQFAVTVDMPDRAERGQGVAVAAPGSSVTFTKEYLAPPIVRCTINDAISGDTVAISSVTETGFGVQILNSGSGVARSIDWQSVGY